MVNQDAIIRVQESWEFIVDIGKDRIGALLFTNLFTTFPHTLELFSFSEENRPLESQAFKHHANAVINTIGLAVASLDDLDKLVPVLRGLGKAHGLLGNNIGSSRYDMLLEMLIKTFHSVLGSDFDVNLETSWREVFSTITTAMQEGTDLKDAAEEEVGRWRRIFDLVTHDDFNPSIEAMQEIVNPLRKSTKQVAEAAAGTATSTGGIPEKRRRQFEHWHLRDKATYRALGIAVGFTTVIALGVVLLVGRKKH